MKPRNAIKMLRRRSDYLERKACAARLVGRPMAFEEAELDAIEVAIAALEELQRRRPELNAVEQEFEFTDRLLEAL